MVTQKKNRLDEYPEIKIFKVRFKQTKKNETFKISFNHKD